MNVSPSYLCKVEKGMINPPVHFKEKCSQYLNEDIDHIFSNPKTSKSAKNVLEDKENFPNNLWAVRQKKKLKQHKLADMIGCSPSYLSKIEKGLQSPSDKFMKKCAKTLRIKVSELFPGKV